MSNLKDHKSGYFITFEGIDYSGKSVQTNLFCQYLMEKKIDYISLRDPGATRISEQIRKILLDNSHTEMSDWTELLLYEAARAQMVEQSILPALAENKLIVCDRFFDSTTAYQGYGRKLDLNIVHNANQIGSCGYTPDLTFLIDLEPKTALQRRTRINADADRLESEGLEFQNRIRNGYLQIAAHEKRVHIVNGNQAVENIHKEIIDIFSATYQGFVD